MNLKIFKSHICRTRRLACSSNILTPIEMTKDCDNCKDVECRKKRMQDLLKKRYYEIGSYEELKLKCAMNCDDLTQAIDALSMKISDHSRLFDFLTFNYFTYRLICSKGGFIWIHHRKKVDPPKVWKGSIIVPDNSLGALAGSPKVIYGDFSVRFNNLKTLEGGPEEVHGFFDCGWNDLKSLKHAPKFVKDWFDCAHNPKTFSPDEVMKTSNVLGKIYWSY